MEEERSENIQAPKEKASIPHVSSFETSTAVDFTMVPKILDLELERHDTDGAMKSVIISASKAWTRKRQENLLSPMTQSPMYDRQINAEKKKALDLLDAISRSGSLPIDATELHVVIGVAHCFDKSIIETVIQDSINPIASVEKSLLLLASTILGDSPPQEFLNEGTEARHRLEAALPSYFALGGQGVSSLDDDADDAASSIA